MTGLSAREELLAMARRWSLTRADLQWVADQLELGERTLWALVEALPELPGIRRSYPQGVTVLLDGRLDVGLVGLGDRPASEFTVPNVHELVDAYMQHVAQAQLRHDPDVARPRAGAGAGAQLVHAARAVSKALYQRGLIAEDRMGGLPEPRRALPTRDPALSFSERGEYLIRILVASPDPALTALLWALFTYWGARQGELLGVHQSAVDVGRGAVLLVGKGAKAREMPCHAPLLSAAGWVLDPRPPAPNGQWLRHLDGRPVTGREFDHWSRIVHERASWAHGHAIGVHVLRHSTARLLAERGLPELAVGLWLGHESPDRFGAVAHYLHSPMTDDWSLRRAIATRAFGPLDRWPDLPELDLLLPWLTATD